MILEIMQYGDFNVKQTNCLFQAPDGTDVKALLDEFYHENRLETVGVVDFESKQLTKPEVSENGITGLRNSSATLKAFVSWLKKRYRVIKTHQISFSD
jgi:hypothetical protein